MSTAATATTIEPIGSRANPDSVWRAVLERDAAHDGQFVYAVATTGIYCRPSCPSRRPNRKNVSFFATPASAEEAGFRACLRCHPKSAVGAQAAAVERARDYLEKNLDTPVTLDVLAREVGLSAFHLQRTFKRFVGVSPRAYAAGLRVERLKSKLKQGDTVSRATYEAGYSSSSRSYAASNEFLGMTPATYRRRGRGMEIRFTTAETAFGRLLVAATERGVCAVTLGSSEESLERALAEEYPEALLERAENGLGKWVGAIIRRIESGETGIAVPLDLQATAFQWKVWRALQEIPYGETRSYSEIAELIGQPKAARAVASACAGNPVAVVIPCHRVVRTGGELGGYRWGVERKEKLLAAERSGRIF
ncbi:MAG: bifunctional DNA-binding transcriptional regulator/O6-methylguanine-DNA methyltransferase Ada [Gemmatimonadota bacterium]